MLIDRFTKKIEDAASRLKKKSSFRFFLFEFLINLMMCPPGYDKVIRLDQNDDSILISYDTIVSSILYFKVYLLLRFFGQASIFRSSIAQKYCEIEGCEANTSFAVKAILKQSPIKVLGFALLISTVIFGVILCNFERPMNEQQGGEGMNFNLTWNGIWLAVVTMTTGIL